MKTRNKSYLDYGIENADAIFERIRKGGVAERKRLLLACYLAYPEIADDLYLSILYKRSYHWIEVYMHPIPINDHDFYAWRRKAIALYDKDGKMDF